MADLSQIKVGNIVYDIKDGYARENGGQKALDFKTSYMHVFEYVAERSICENILIYVPMDTPDLQGADFLSLHIDGIMSMFDNLVKPGMFAIISRSDYNSSGSFAPEIAKIDIYEISYNEETYEGNYCLRVEIIGGAMMNIDELTFVSEKVI